MLFVILLAVALALVAFCGLPGAMLATVWIGIGIYMVINSRSRGFYADATFILAWPIHVVLDR